MMIDIRDLKTGKWSEEKFYAKEEELKAMTYDDLKKEMHKVVKWIKKVKGIPALEKINETSLEYEQDD